MRDRKRRLAYGAMCAIFIAVSVLVFTVHNKRLSDQLLEAFGLGAADLAAHLASDVLLTDEDVARLKGLEFDELPEDPVNASFTATVNEADYRLPLKFAYLYCPLRDDEIKYIVDEEHAAFYGEKPGTPLDVIWLLDVVVEPDQQVEDLYAEGGFYEDIHRYSHMDERERAIMESREATYALTEDEWGTGITGYAPVYTSEGNYVGMLGVDIYITPYVAAKNDLLLGLILFYAAITGTLCAMFFYVYRKYLRVRNQQLYLDPLTNAYNRRYFNEVFASTLNIRKNLDKYLVLLMFDIDFFKRINDRYGHDMGDLCLKAITEAIVRTMHAPPNVLIRYGGEEFLAAITVANNHEAEARLADIMKNIRELDMFGDGYKVTTSVGGAILPYRDIERTNMEFVVKVADDNLYFCKNSGRDRSKITDYSDAPV